jgi:hypothetical protein
VSAIEVDVWVRGTVDVNTRTIAGLPADPETWTEDEVRRLLSEMLLAIEREKNPGGEPPPVTLRGFSWIVSSYDRGGVILHIEMPMGTASAGPIATSEPRLTRLVSKAVTDPQQSSGRVH